MKKRIAVLLVLILVLTMTACGAPEPTPLDGKWVAMAGEMMGIQVPIADVMGGDFYFEILGEGKVTVTVDDKSEKDSWSLDGTQFTLNIRGADPCVGTWDGDMIVFDDMLGSGLTMIFGREGTDAADPANYGNVDDIMSMIEGLGE